MSTLKVNNVQDLGADAVVTNGVVNASALPAGSILQVVSTTKTDTFTESVTASGGLSADVTGLTASITPSSASNKILVTVALNGSTVSGGGSPVMFLYRGGSVITGATGDAAGSRRRATSSIVGSNARTPISGIISFLDSPSTTSSTTYSIRLAHDSSTTQTVAVNRGGDDTDGANTFRNISTITLMEVAG